MTTPTTLDLDAYLRRIGFDGRREPTLAVLQALHALHPAAIAFENISPLIGEPVSLALADIEAKLVRGGRGGYCYEHNILFMAALQALGFAVEGLAARALWGLPADAPPRPRTHMSLRVTLPEGAFLADVGFGGLTQTSLLKLEAGLAQPTPHETFRLIDRDDELELQVDLDGDWRPMILIGPQAQLLADYEPSNWFVATHPASPMTTHLMAARALPGRRLSLIDRRLTVRRKGQAAEVRTLDTLEVVAETLTRYFGVSLPEGFDRIGPKLGF